MRIANLLLVLVLLLTADQTWTATTSPRSSLVVPTQFPTIQQAVNAAQLGDTIQLLAGTYAEHVTIPKSLTLVGAGASSSVIQARPVMIPDTFGSIAIEIKRGAKVTVSGSPGRGAAHADRAA
jgi:hypothetical protein